MYWQLAEQAFHKISTYLGPLFDIAVVAFMIYRLLLLVRGSRAWQIILGLAFFIVTLWFSDLAGMRTLNWILDKGITLGPVAVVILFYPELRQALEQFGRLGFWRQSFAVIPDENTSDLIEAIVRAVNDMASRSLGALLVFERINRLDDVAANGIRMDATISSELLTAVFTPHNPLHDGAAIIRGSRLLSAACQLPMSDNPLDPAVHMRHRAAVGMTEQSDAICVVVSEERGQVSVAAEGILRRGVPADQLREVLLQVYHKPQKPLAPLLRLRKQVDKAVAKVRNRSNAG